VLVAGLLACVKAHERGGLRRTWVDWSDVEEAEAVCVADVAWCGLLTTWVASSREETGG